MIISWKKFFALDDDYDSCFVEIIQIYYISNDFRAINQRMSVVLIEKALSIGSEILAQSKLIFISYK